MVATKNRISHIEIEPLRWKHSITVGQLSSLIVLDVADDKLSGPIPQCLYNLTAMVKGSYFTMIIAYSALCWKINLMNGSSNHVKTI